MKFEDFCEIQPHIPLEKGEEYAFIPMAEVYPSVNLQVSRNVRKFTGGGARFQENDTIFARITPCLENGKIALVEELETDGGFGSTEYFVFRAKPSVSDSNYLFYLSKSLKIVGPAIKSMVGSSGRQRARKEVIGSVDLDVPEISVQEKIGSCLKTYDELVQNNRRRVVLLEKLARMLFREWFVHFRFPGHEHVPIVEGLPDGWRWIPASEALYVNERTLWDKKNPIKMLPMAAVSETGMSCDLDLLEVRLKAVGVKFRNGDTLLARITPCLENGKTGYVNFLKKGEVACGVPPLSGPV